MKTKKLMPYIVFGLIGALFGCLLFRLFRCMEGTCPLRSSVWRSAAYCAFAGLIFAHISNM